MLIVWCIDTCGNTSCVFPHRKNAALQLWTGVHCLLQYSNLMPLWQRILKLLMQLVLTSSVFCRYYGLEMWCKPCLITGKELKLYARNWQAWDWGQCSYLTALGTVLHLNCLMFKCLQIQNEDVVTNARYRWKLNCEVFLTCLILYSALPFASNCFAICTSLETSLAYFSSLRCLFSFPSNWQQSPSPEKWALDLLCQAAC